MRLFHTVLLTAGLAAAVSLSFACSSEADGSPTGAGAGATGGSAEGGGGSTSTTGHVPMVCGGKAGATCAPHYVCGYPDNRCGADDQTGICHPVSLDCDGTPIQSVCGCDGKVYGNPCIANISYVDVSVDACATPDGTFKCGTTFCKVGEESCSHYPSDVTGVPDGWQCFPLPAGCADCACVPPDPNPSCSFDCKVAADGSIETTCGG